MVRERRVAALEANRWLSVNIELKRGRAIDFQDPSRVLFKTPSKYFFTSKTLCLCLYGELNACAFVFMGIYVGMHATPSAVCSQPQYGIYLFNFSANFMLSLFGTARHSFLTPYFWANSD